MMHKKKNTWANAAKSKEQYGKYSCIPFTDNPVLCQMYLTMYQAMEFAANLYGKRSFINSIGSLNEEAQKWKAKNGDDMLHQLLELESVILSGEVNTQEEMLDVINFSGKCNPNAIRLASTLLSGEMESNSYFQKDVEFGHLGEAYLGIASRFFVIPYDTCRYSRVSDEAVEYLVSLGQPSDEVWVSFFEYMELMASESHNGNYEEVLSFNIDGQSNSIYYGFRNNFVYCYHYSIEDVTQSVLKKNDFNRYVANGNPILRYRDDGSTRPNVLDIDDWSFLINLWAAKQHNDFVVGDELRENMATVAESVNAICKKPNMSKYTYVHISETGRKVFAEAKRLIAEFNGNVEYRKTMWYTKAYYARRGKNGVIVYNRASIHHRKCAKPTEEPSITVYT